MPRTANNNSAFLNVHKFKTSMCPFIGRLYRTSLIATGSPRAATMLLQEMYRKAWVHYRSADHIADFAIWLAKLVSQNFVLRPQRR